MRKHEELRRPLAGGLPVRSTRLCCLCSWLVTCLPWSAPKRQREEPAAVTDLKAVKVAEDSLASTAAAAASATAGAADAAVVPPQVEPAVVGDGKPEAKADTDDDDDGDDGDVALAGRGRCVFATCLRAGLHPCTRQSICILP